MPLSHYRLFQLSSFADSQAANAKRIGKILGQNKPVYTLPHVQWGNHVARVKTIKNNTLLNIKRFKPL